MTRAIRVEWQKLARSRVTLVATALMGLLLPAIGLSFYSVALSGGNGALADKARAFLVDEGWAGYLGLVDQIAAVAVFLGAGIVVAWAFGREHTDRTFPSLFALPVSRGKIAAAKFAVLIAWTVVLSVVVSLVTVVLGLAGGVGPLTAELVGPEVVRLQGVSIAAGLLALSMGFVASLGRGYLPAIGVLAVIIAITQVAVLFGTGGWFPFAVPGLMAVAGVESIPEPTAPQVLLVPAVAALGVWLTIRWWQRAEVVSRLSRSR
jgi:ABC-2 type transport system permease protein